MDELMITLTEQEWIDVANFCQDGSVGYGAKLANEIRRQLLAIRSSELSKVIG